MVLACEDIVTRPLKSTCYSPDTSVMISSGEARYIGTQAVTTDVHILILQIRVPI